MKWSFWLGFLSMVLNVLFIIDFMTYALYGKSLAAISFKDGGSLADLLLQYYPEMTAAEFLAANGILLGVSVMLLLLSIWISYYGTGVIVENSSCECKCPRKAKP